MRMTGVKPEVGAGLIHLPLSEMQFCAFRGAHFWVFPCQLYQPCQPFQPEKGLKMPFFARKQCYLGSGGQFNTLPPYFAGARLKKTRVSGLGT